MTAPIIRTIGHSTQPLEDLIATLWDNQVTMLIDIRTVPRSRTNPQFNKDALARDLPQAGIAYRHMPELGGLRHPRPDSANQVWENSSFRGYADYMETDQFRQAIDRLITMSQAENIAIMCAESLWWRCHRSMVSDELIARGLVVEHLLPGKRQRHTLRSFAHIKNGHVSYHRA